MVTTGFAKSPGTEIFSDYNFEASSALIRVPLCSGDVVSFEDVKQRIFVIQLKLQLLSRPVLLLPQEKTQQGLTLQCCNILEGEIITQHKKIEKQQSF